jgi:hypothetical protein
MEAIKNPSGINTFQSSHSAWAEDFIRSENVTSGNFSQSESFRSLTRSQKDAVRYQFKKQSSGKSFSTTATVPKTFNQTPIRNQAPIKWLQRAGLALGLWISFFLMRDLVEFYQLKGLSFIWALQLALVVELALFFASISSKRVLRACAYGLLFYNASIFILLQITQANQQKEDVNLRQEKIQGTSRSILDLEKEKAQNLKRLDTLFERGIVTSGSKAIAELNAKIDSQIQERRLWLEELEKAHTGNLGQVFTIGTILMIVVRLILQLISIELFKSAGICTLGRDPRERVAALGAFRS